MHLGYEFQQTSCRQEDPLTKVAPRLETRYDYYTCGETNRGHKDSRDKKQGLQQHAQIPASAAAAVESAMVGGEVGCVDTTCPQLMW